MRVELLGHLGVRLEERVRPEPDAQPEDLLLDRVLAPEQLRRHVRLLGRGVVHRPVDRADLREAPEDVDEVAGLEALARRGDEHDERLAGVSPLAEDEVSEVALARRLVVRLELLLARPASHGLADGVPEVGRQQARVDPDDLVPAAGAMESEVDPVLPRRERVLELVAVVVERRRRHDRLDVRVGDPPDPHERVANLLLLLAQPAPRTRDPGSDIRRTRRSAGTEPRRAPRWPRGRSRAVASANPRFVFVTRARTRSRAARRERTPRIRSGERRRCRRTRASRSGARAPPLSERARPCRPG